MLSYFEYIINPTTSQTVMYFFFIGLAFIYGCINAAESGKWIKSLVIQLVVWGAISVLAPTVDYYAGYRPDYKICNVDTNISKGYKMKDYSCYRPYVEGEYVPVNSSPKTKGDFE